jgi:hypothetical protein
VSVSGEDDSCWLYGCSCILQFCKWTKSGVEWDAKGYKCDRLCPIMEFCRVSETPRTFLFQILLPTGIRAHSLLRRERQPIQRAVSSWKQIKIINRAGKEHVNGSLGQFVTLTPRSKRGWKYRLGVEKFNSTSSKYFYDYRKNYRSIKQNAIYSTLNIS